MSKRLWFRISYLVTVLALLAISFWFIRAMFPVDYAASKETAQLRNSLIAKVGAPGDFNWTPDNVPESFLWERREVPEEFRAISKKIFSEDLKEISNFEKALVIARHLNPGARGNGSPISSSTADAYRKITSQAGLGWCSDFTQVFNGIGLASNIPVREWGMSFEGYSGKGHALTEIYDDELKKWVLIDATFGFYVRDRTTEIPLSTMEFRDLLLRGRTDTIKIVPIGSKMGFNSPKKAFDYYLRGSDQFYLWWGNNVYSYDANLFVRLFSHLSISLSQAAAILVGVHPGIRIISSPSNQGYVAALFEKRRTVIFMTALGFVFGIVWIVQTVIILRQRPTV